MIGSKYIIRYTDALYSTPAEYAPRYDEFRDMFSSGQINSKEWLIRKLMLYSSDVYNCTAVVAGAWFGTLGILLRKEFPEMKVNMIDIDDRCEKFVKNIIYDDPKSAYITADMYEYHYKEHLVINTSCEHIPDLREWVGIIPRGRLVVLQSNNYIAGNGHINCVSSEDEFVEKANLNDVRYKGKLEMPMYTRYMIIGTT